jgi:hypothetical protein
MLAYLSRIGAPLIEPRAAMRRAVEAPAGKGAADVTVVVLLAWVGEQLPGLVHAFFRARELGLGAGLQSILMLLRAILPIALGILVAALVLSVLAGRRRGPAATPPRADAVDLSAYSALPFILVTACADLVIGLLDRPPPPTVATGVLVVGFAWSLVPWLCAVLALRAVRGGEA